MISQYRLFKNTNTFYPDDIRTFLLRGKVPVNNRLFVDIRIPTIEYIHGMLFESLESLGYEYEENQQYDAIELDVEESDLEW